MSRLIFMSSIKRTGWRPTRSCPSRGREWRRHLNVVRYPKLMARRYRDWAISRQHHLRIRELFWIITLLVAASWAKRIRFRHPPRCRLRILPFSNSHWIRGLFIIRVVNSSRRKYRSRLKTQRLLNLLSRMRWWTGRETCWLTVVRAKCLYRHF